MLTPKAFYAAYTNSDIMSPDSTSGGICTLASQEVINNGGVVFSVRFTEDWNVEYSRVDNLLDLKNHIGSKYMQAYFNNVQLLIAEELKIGKKVLLVGTPCFVSAIKKYLMVCQIDIKQLITIDFICHGVPSAEIGQNFIRFLERKNGIRLEKYNFRSKANGWGKLSRSTKFEEKKEKAIRANFCPLHTWFGHHLSLRESCFACDYRYIDRPSDITVADFWKIDKYYPDIPMKQGVSSVQVNSEQGEEFYNCLIKTGKVISVPVTMASIWEHRKTATKNFKKPEAYNQFWEIWNSSGLEGIKKFAPPQTVVSLVKAKLNAIFK